MPDRHGQQISLQEYPNRGLFRNLGVRHGEELALANPSRLFLAYLERREMGQGESRWNEIGLNRIEVTQEVEG